MKLKEEKYEKNDSSNNILAEKMENDLFYSSS